MLVIGTIAWICFLLWLLLLALPSKQMMQEPAGNPAYYVIWVLVVGAAVVFHYRFMAYYHHRSLALASDIVSLTVFLIVLFIQYLSRTRGGEDHVR